MSLSSLSSWPCPCLPCLPCPFGRVLVFLVFLVFLAVSLSSLSSLSFWSCPCLPCLPCLFGRVLVILVFSEGKTEDTIFWGKTRWFLREKQGDTRETRFLREKGALSEGKPAHTPHKPFGWVHQVAAVTKHLPGGVLKRSLRIMPLA